MDGNKNNAPRDNYFYSVGATSWAVSGGRQQLGKLTGPSTGNELMILEDMILFLYVDLTMEELAALGAAGD